MYQDLESIAAARRAAERAHEAWLRFREFDPSDVDRIVDAMANAAAANARRLAEMAHAETGYGVVDDKVAKNLYNSIVVADWLRNVRTLGVLWRDETSKVVAIGEPMGVVAGLVPVTHPTALVIFKALSAVKSGNAIVLAPHPRGATSSMETTTVLADAAVAAGAPANLLQCLPGGTLDGTQALMKHHRTSVVLATGGANMVRAAYSSGKPTIAVGPGNVPCYIDRSKRDELAEIAEMIVASKDFDHGTGCVCEQALIVDRPVAGMFEQELRAAGAHFCTRQQADALGKLMFTPGLDIVPDTVGQSAATLAERAGFSVSPRTCLLIASLEHVGRSEPLSAEKLSPVLAWYTVDGYKQGYELSRQILRFGGEGHSTALHADDPDVVALLSGLPAGRVLVNVPCMHAGIGYAADIDPSFMLGTGTLAGSIVSDNVTALHLINIKRVAYQSRPWRSLGALVEGSI